MIVAAAAAHVDAMVDRLRPAHVAELAERGMAVREALELGLRCSVAAWSALDDAEPVAMWGLAPASVLGDMAYPWLITTTATDRHKVRFWRECLRQTSRMRALYPVLTNEFDVRDAEACRLLARLGFRPVGAAEPFRTYVLGA